MYGMLMLFCKITGKREHYNNKSNNKKKKWN